MDTEKVDKEILPEIPFDQVFPENKIKQQHIDREDGQYVLSNSWKTNIKDVVHIKDKKLVQYDYYLRDQETGEEYIYLIWSFDYDEKMSIYREFPTLNIPKRIFCDNVVGRYDKESQKQFNEQWNKMLGQVLNESMQLHDNVKSVSNCPVCDKAMANCKDGSMVMWCEHVPKTSFISTLTHGMRYFCIGFSLGYSLVRVFRNL